MNSDLGAARGASRGHRRTASSGQGVATAGELGPEWTEEVDQVCCLNLPPSRWLCATSAYTMPTSCERYGHRRTHMNDCFDILCPCYKFYIYTELLQCSQMTATATVYFHLSSIAQATSVVQGKGAQVYLCSSAVHLAQLKSKQLILVFSSSPQGSFLTSGWFDNCSTKLCTPTMYF